MHPDFKNMDEHLSLNTINKKLNMCVHPTATYPTAPTVHHNHNSVFHLAIDVIATHEANKY